MPNNDTIDITIPVEASVAQRWGSDGMRRLLGRLVSDMFRPGDPDRLFELMNKAAAQAESRGLTDELLESELAAHKAERRIKRQLATE